MMKKKDFLRYVDEAIQRALHAAVEVGQEEDIRYLEIALARVTAERDDLQRQLGERPTDLVPREQLETVAAQRDALVTKLHALRKKPVARKPRARKP